MGSGCYQRIHLDRNAEIDLSLGYLFDQGSRYFPKRCQTLSPIMDTEQVSWRFPEHGADFFIVHRVVSADRRQNVGQGIPEILPCHFRQQAGL